MIIMAHGHLADAHATNTVKFSTPRTLVSIQVSKAVEGLDRLPL